MENHESYYSQKLNSMTIDKLIQELKPKSIEKLSESIGSLSTYSLFQIMEKVSGINFKNVYDSLSLPKDQFDFQDNFRLCVVGDAFGERLYSISKAKGCCGFYEKTIKFEKKEVKIGFNYGH